jgi:hypothetical protein
VDGGEDGAHHRAGDGHLGQLEGDGAGVTHDTRPDLDQLQLEAGQRPVSHGLPIRHRQVHRAVAAL